MNIAVLMTCHNRVKTTLVSLGSLFPQAIPAGSSFSVYLVDDGSTDGTSHAVKNSYPIVNVIQGNGNLFWNQGMRLAWETAVKSGDWDAFLWLNDDTRLIAGALRFLCDTLETQCKATGRKGIVVGACKDPFSSEPALTYGGLVNGRYAVPKDKPQPVDRFNGNIVLVAREVYEKIGNLSPHYRHSFGDFDYGIRANKAGFPVWLAPGFIGECARNKRLKWQDPEVPFFQRLKAFRGPKGFTLEELRAFGQVRGQRFWFLSVLRQYCKVCFPRLGSQETSRLNKSLD